VALVKTVLVTFGTRPEAIKMAPVVKALRARPDALRCVVCVTAQHRDMLDQVLPLFDLRPEFDLDLMRPGQHPSQVTARVLESMTDVIRETTADEVVVQGDTTTAMATAMAAFHLEVPVGHVEAGLRSGRMDAPFPEEMNRVVIDRLAAHLFPPTPRADAHLEAEGVDPARRLVTGNTGIDALLDLRDRLGDLDLPVRAGLEHADRLVLVTAHRRESFGAPMRQVFEALGALAAAHSDVTFVYPVHPNPQVRGPAHAMLSAPNLRLVDPVHYGELVWLLDRCELALSDSGGLQEEAPTLGKPLLVLREVTERPELVEAGAGLLVGTDRDRIVDEASRLLASAEARAAMGRPRHLFGDGRAATRIAARLAGETASAWEPAATEGARA
jgi:UDP-N-acetylglucosamine 2-epimerase